MTNAEAWFNNSLRPRKPDGSLGRTTQDVHLDSHTVPELCLKHIPFNIALRPQRPYGLLGTGNPGRPPRLSLSSEAQSSMVNTWMGDRYVQKTRGDLRTPRNFSEPSSVKSCSTKFVRIGQ